VRGRSKPFLEHEDKELEGDRDEDKDGKAVNNQCGIQVSAQKENIMACPMVTLAMAIVAVGFSSRGGVTMVVVVGSMIVVGVIVIGMIIRGRSGRTVPASGSK